MNKKKNKRLKAIGPIDILGRLIVFAYAMMLTIPFFFVIITSLKTREERIMNPIGLPESLNLQNYVTAWREGGLLSAAKNSIIITVGGTALFLFFVVLVSYCINRIRSTKVGTFIYIFFLVSMFIPNVSQVTSLMLRRQLGLYNNLFGEILCSSIGITTAVFIVTGFLRTIPRDLEEAAMLDGANDWQICTNVLMPLILPSLVTVGILHFTDLWNSALGPMLTLRDEKLYTIPMALLINFSSEYSVEYTVVFAAAIITAVPVIIIYVKQQKHFVSALAGGVKG